MEKERKEKKENIIMARERERTGRNNELKSGKVKNGYGFARFKSSYLGQDFSVPPRADHGEKHNTTAHVPSNTSIPPPLPFPPTNPRLLHRVIFLIPPLPQLARLKIPLLVVNPVFSIRHLAHVSFGFTHLPHFISHSPGFGQLGQHCFTSSHTRFLLLYVCCQ